MKKYIAEILGTFALTLIIGLSLSGTFPLPTPVLAALTLGLFVYTVGHISGAHLNPAVTLGAWSINKISIQDAMYYIVAQFAGASIATILLVYTVGMPTVTATTSWAVFWSEMVGAFFFAFGIAAVMYGKVSSSLSGVVIGASLFIGIAIAALMGSNGVLNPAVALGIKSFNVVYFIGPVVGAVLGMQAYRKLS